MTFRLLAHQSRAAVILEETLNAYGGAILADAIGSGKSYVALELMRRARACDRRVLIIAPASLREQWRRFADEVGTDIEVTSHDSLRGRAIVPGSFDDALVVVDEAHRFRNPSSERYGALARLLVNARPLLVTATYVR